MSSLSSRMRQAGRALARRPLYAAVAVVTVAAGIAAWTAAFVLVDAALLSPLPFAEPERLVSPDVISERGFRISISVPNYRDWSEQSRVFASTGAAAGWSVVLTGRGAARTLDARELYGDFFGTLGLAPARGRLFGAAETRRGAAPIAVLGDAFFRELGGDPALVGSTLTLDGRAYEVVGVLPPGAGYPSRATEIYLPLGALGDDIPWQDRDSGFGLRLIGRLAPGVTLEAAQRDLERVADGVIEAEGHAGEKPRVRALSDLFVGDLRAPLSLLFAAAALVVTLALANVVNLFLARGEARRSELAIRAALGAPRLDLVRLQLAESAWISAAGALVGALGAAGLLTLFGDRVAADVPRFVADRLHVGPAALAFALALSAFVALALAVLPALVVPRGAAAEALHGSRAGLSRATTRFRSALVVGELALGTVLVVGAALLATSLDRLRNVDKGFDATGVVAGRVASPSGKFADAAAWLAFQRRMLEGAGALPGVRSASLSLLLPLGDRSWEMGLVPEGRPYDREHTDSVLYNIVSERFFETLGIPLLRGRLFGPGDRDGAELVTVVDASLAERYWPGQDPIGKRVTFETGGAMHGPDAKPIYRTIVGVVKSLRHYELQNPSRIQAYIPLEQAGGRWGLDLSLAVRTGGAVAPFVAQLPKLVAGLDPGIPVSETAPLAASVERAVAQPALLARTVTALGALALLLAAVGVFALASFGVAQRRREIGVRQALGATPRAVMAAVLGQAARWSVWGIGAGVVASAVAARLSHALLWGVAGFEPGAYLGAFALLVASALAASALPAARAARLDPARILRDDT